MILFRVGRGLVLRCRGMCPGMWCILGGWECREVKSFESGQQEPMAVKLVLLSSLVRMRCATTQPVPSQPTVATN